jgi:hypothetical protein
VRGNANRLFERSVDVHGIVVDVDDNLRTGDAEPAERFGDGGDGVRIFFRLRYGRESGRALVAATKGASEVNVGLVGEAVKLNLVLEHDHAASDGSAGNSADVVNGETADGLLSVVLFIVIGGIVQPHPLRGTRNGRTDVKLRSSP